MLVDLPGAVIVERLSGRRSCPKAGATYPVTELAGDRIVLERSKHRTCLLSSPRRNYFDILRSKLHWGDVPRAPDPSGGRRIGVRR
mgnify:CR=1 FL=1